MRSAKPTSATTAVSHPRTAEEMRTAVARVVACLNTEMLRADDDHPADVFSDVMDELLELRALKAKVAQQQNDLKPFFVRK